LQLPPASWAFLGPVACWHSTPWLRRCRSALAGAAEARSVRRPEILRAQQTQCRVGL